MARGEEEEEIPKKVTDIEAMQSNVTNAVAAFNEQWISMPRFSLDCTVMDCRQLRNAMGLRSTLEAGDAWPMAEQLLLHYGFRWHQLGGTRVMYLQERDSFIPDTGWQEAEKWEEETEN